MDVRVMFGGRGVDKGGLGKGVRHWRMKGPKVIVVDETGFERWRLVREAQDML
jgi:hypothetical protein